MTIVTTTAEHKARRGNCVCELSPVSSGMICHSESKPVTVNLCTNFELHGFTYPKNMKVKTLPYRTTHTLYKAVDVAQTSEDPLKCAVNLEKLKKNMK